MILQIGGFFWNAPVKRALHQPNPPNQVCCVAQSEPVDRTMGMKEAPFKSHGMRGCT